MCNRFPDFASSYFGAFPSFDSDILPFRPLHGYWDSSELSSDSLGIIMMPAHFVQIHKLFTWHNYSTAPKGSQHGTGGGCHNG